MFVRIEVVAADAADAAVRIEFLQMRDFWWTTFTSRRSRAYSRNYTQWKVCVERVILEMSVLNALVMRCV